jgi:hypothetical protein
MDDRDGKIQTLLVVVIQCQPVVPLAALRLARIRGRADCGSMYSRVSPGPGTGVILSTTTRNPGKLTLPCLTDTKCHALRGSTFSSAA